jgi:FimV-like protein
LAEPAESSELPQRESNLDAAPAGQPGEQPAETPAEPGEASSFEYTPNLPVIPVPDLEASDDFNGFDEPVPHAQEALHDLDPVAGVPSYVEPWNETPAEPPAPAKFPHDAVAAFSGLDFGLPPRMESPAGFTPSSTQATQPVVEPGITAQQAVPVQPPAPANVGEQIAAGTAGAAAVAGLGAARFGALNLDFDLELPPNPAQPVPSFTPQDLVRIARNKLDLASEYIELGDLAGARALIQEVIEANDAGTRTEARALLSTLAPLS